MKSTLIVALLVGASVASGNSVQEHPIGKVVTMLQGLAETAESEGKTEAVAFSKYQYWCKNSVKELSAAIADEKETIDSLESKIEAKTKEAATLEEEIAALDDQIAKMQAGAVKAKDGRKDAHDLYLDASKVLKDTVKAIGEAIVALEEAGETTEASFAQRKVGKVLSLIQEGVTVEQRSTLSAFANGRPDQMAAGDKGAHVDKYAFKSGNVIELMKSLKMKFEDESLATEKAETNSLNGYKLVKNAADSAEDAAEDNKGAKESALGACNEELEDAKAALKDTQEDLEADSTTLGETEKSCRLKTGEWNERSKTREQEIEAINMAVKILAKVGGVRTEASDNAGPPPSPVAFLQTSEVSNPRMKAVELLRSTAKVTHAKALERLAQEISVHMNAPFDEINQMVQKMIFRLMSEQKDEDDHKNWCDQELEKTDTMKEHKEDKIEDLTTKIEEHKADVMDLTEDIASAEEMMAEIEAHMEKSTDMRNDGKNENAISLKDSEAAQNAVASATAVLEQFYKESGAVKKEEYELVQRGVDLPAEPSTWDAGYTGVADPSAQPGGILTILERTAADFAKMEADTRAQETMDQKAYEEDMKDCTIEKARRTKESEMKTSEKKRLSDKIDAMTKSRKHSQSELDATEQYLKDLQPACVSGDSSYEDRKAARATEIKALQKVQGILTDAFKEKEAGSFMQRPHLRAGRV